tara:strand:+ start:357 stop:1046 length:690 start_codon:yes stop_codon:yes gene_type:complete
MSKDLVLELNGISKIYNEGGSDKIVIFKNINLNIKKSELVGIIAPSGTGKTSLLNICGLLDLPSCGEVRILNKNTKSLTTEMRNNVRRNHLGFVFQSSNLLNEFTAIENVALSRIIKGYNFPDALDYAKKLLVNIGLENRLYNRPLRLSGGEKQRVAICRAIANDPNLLLADEPTGNLDNENSQLVFNLLINLVKKKKVSALVATHNLDLIKKMDRVFSLTKNGFKEMK